MKVLRKITALNIGDVISTGSDKRQELCDVIKILPKATSVTLYLHPRGSKKLFEFTFHVEDAVEIWLDRCNELPETVLFDELGY